MRFKILEHLQIQFGKGFESELHARLGQGRLGYNPFGDIEPANGLEEFVEFVLIGAPHEIDEKTNQSGTCIGNQVQCQSCQLGWKFSAWCAPFV